MKIPDFQRSRITPAARSWFLRRLKLMIAVGLFAAGVIAVWTLAR